MSSGSPELSIGITRSSMLGRVSFSCNTHTHTRLIVNRRSFVCIVRSFEGEINTYCTHHPVKLSLLLLSKTIYTLVKLWS